MKTKEAIEVLVNYNKWLNIPYDGDRIITDDVPPNIEDFQQALCKAIEVMTKVYTFDKEMKELEEYLKETRSTGNESD